MVPPMTNSTQTPTSPTDAPSTDDRGWKQLSQNILTLALGKSERMIVEENVDDAAFDRDARDLRLLMSSAEIADRMDRHNEKDRRPHDEEASPREYSEEELDDIFKRVSARVDDLGADERERRNGAAAADSGRDAAGDPSNTSEQGMADQCA